MPAKLLTEFIGTFFLVLAVCLTGVAGLETAPLAVGLSLMVMVYMGGHVSGAHYNPAVSLSAALSGALKFADLVPYWAAQAAGALAAAYASRAATGLTFAPAPGDADAVGRALLVEGLFTFALALVVLNVAVSKRTRGNSYFGAAIGMTVAAAAFIGGPISGGAFNPAVGFGPTFVHALHGGGAWSHLWLYLVGPVAGAAVAAGVFAVQERGTPAA